ncbi:hypothetical protein FOH10_26685 [Nocardia otitidiscaviarum]|uniref:Outer membrane channel protein CpnT-like N-terminal domain-containing protein n=1 Tax=Nocardia otitidiscaviarum TaxID=1823 RepID=A0A516NSA5_9NOCA|nr:hypothetical protein [Nocardia otitidiscaviarum]MCP9621018.1 hypothetical protein [Nocardia otitidiscaviarum]QDP81782.1 hypothetical protein FOH10_26685 [Nocardia otitidiscaviarum]
MALQFPSWLEWLEWLVGADWPHGNEDLMWQMGRDLQAVADEVDALLNDLDDLVRGVGDAYPDGTGGDKILEWLKPLREGEGSEEHGSIGQLAEHYRSLAAAADGMGDELQAAKLSFYIAGGWLLAELAWAAAAGPAAPLLHGTIFAMARITFRKLAERLALRITTTLGRHITKPVLQRVLPKLVYEIGQEALVETVQGVSEELLVQAIQNQTGSIDGYDWNKVGINAAVSAFAGGVGGGVGFGAGHLFPTDMGGWKGALNGALTGATAGTAGAGAAWLGGGALTGNWDFDPRSLTGGALSGAGPSALYGFSGKSDFSGAPLDSTIGDGSSTGPVPGGTTPDPTGSDTTTSPTGTDTTTSPTGTDGEPGTTGGNAPNVGANSGSTISGDGLSLRPAGSSETAPTGTDSASRSGGDQTSSSGGESPGGGQTGRSSSEADADAGGRSDRADSESSDGGTRAGDKSGGEPGGSDTDSSSNRDESDRREDSQRGETDSDHATSEQDSTRDGTEPSSASDDPHSNSDTSDNSKSPPGQRSAIDAPATNAGSTSPTADTGAASTAAIGAGPAAPLGGAPTGLAGSTSGTSGTTASAPTSTTASTSSPSGSGARGADSTGANRVTPANAGPAASPGTTPTTPPNASSTALPGTTPSVSPTTSPTTSPTPSDASPTAPSDATATAPSHANPTTPSDATSPTPSDATSATLPDNGPTVPPLDGGSSAPSQFAPATADADRPSAGVEIRAGADRGPYPGTTGPMQAGRTGVEPPGAPASADTTVDREQSSPDTPVDTAAVVPIATPVPGPSGSDSTPQGTRGPNRSPEHGTASRVGDFDGGARPEGQPDLTPERLSGEIGNNLGLITPEGMAWNRDQGHFVLPDGRTVTVAVGPTTDGAVAEFTSRPDGSGYDVHVSPRTRDQDVVRAVAHELAEIRLSQDPVIDIDPTADRPSQQTPHLDGRFAELRVLTAQIDRATFDPARSRELPGLRTDLNDLVNQLGFHDPEHADTVRQHLTDRHPELARRIDLELRDVLGARPTIDQNLPNTDLDPTAHLDRLRHLLGGDFVDDVVRAEQRALDGRMREELARRVFDPIFNDPAAAPARKTVKTPELLRALDPINEAINNPTLSGPDRAQAVHQAIDEFHNSMPDTFRDALGPAAFHRMHEAADAFGIGPTRITGVLDPATGALTVDGEQTTLGDLLRQVDRANRGATENGLNLEFAVIVHDPADGAAAVEILSRPRPQHRLPLAQNVFGPDNQPLPHQPRPSVPAAVAGAHTIDVGVGRSAFAVEMTPVGDRSGAGLVIKTELASDFAVAGQRRRNLGILDPGPLTEPGTVMVFGDLLFSGHVLGDGTTGDVARIYINNVSAKLPDAAYDALAAGLANTLAPGGRIELQWDMKPEKPIENGGRLGDRGHIDGDKLWEAIQRRYGDTGGPFRVAESTEFPPPGNDDYDYTIDAGASNTLDAGKMAQFVPPRPDHRMVIVYDPDGTQATESVADQLNSQHTRFTDADAESPTTRYAEPTPAGVSHHRGDPVLGDLPHRVSPDPNRFTADVHITPDGHAHIGDDVYTPAQYGDLLRRTGWDGSTPIRLIGCDAGSNTFATRLAEHLGVDVLAPTAPAWTDSAGRVYTSTAEIGPDGNRRPRIPPDGLWQTHHPDGTTTPATEDGFAPGTRPEDVVGLDPDQARDRARDLPDTPQRLEDFRELRDENRERRLEGFGSVQNMTQRHPAVDAGRRPLDRALTTARYRDAGTGTATDFFNFSGAHHDWTPAKEAPARPPKGQRVFETFHATSYDPETGVPRTGEGTDRANDSEPKLFEELLRHQLEQYSGLRREDVERVLNEAIQAVDTAAKADYAEVRKTWLEINRFLVEDNRDAAREAAANGTPYTPRTIRDATVHELVNDTDLPWELVDQVVQDAQEVHKSAVPDMRPGRAAEEQRTRLRIELAIDELNARAAAAAAREGRPHTPFTAADITGDLRLVIDLPSARTHDMPERFQICFSCTNLLEVYQRMFPNIRLEAVNLALDRLYPL